MKNPISVVITTYNSESKIVDCIKSVNFADEVIVVDGSSSDNTPKLAKDNGAKLVKRPNNPMLNKNKNFGFSQARNEWVLSLDSDERVTPELKEEILGVVKDKNEKNGYFVPRKNIIFGKWIEHTGWYPDYQLRLFKKGKGKFAEKHVHELLEVDGEIGHLSHPFLHYNYDSVSQFLDKTFKIYTISEAENLINNGYQAELVDAIRMPAKEFLNRYFFGKGFLDGSHGLILSLLMAFYHLVVFLRVWEAQGYKDTEENTLLTFEAEFKKVVRDIVFWINQERVKQTKNIFNKLFLKAKGKIAK